MSAVFLLTKVILISSSICFCGEIKQNYLYGYSSYLKLWSLPYIQCWFKGVDTLSGVTTLSKLFLTPSENGSTLKGKNLLNESKFFPFRVDPFSEGDWCAGMQSESHKSCLPCKMTENLPCVSSPHNSRLTFDAKVLRFFFSFSVKIWGSSDYHP